MKFHENLNSIILTEDVTVVLAYHLQYVDQHFFSPYMCKNIFEVNGNFSCHFIANIPRKL